MSNKVLFVLLLFVGVQSHAFSESGFSKKNCEAAAKDALRMADGHCLGIDTDGVTRARFGKCRKINSSYKIHIYYTCKMPDVDTDYDRDLSKDI